MMRYVFVFMGIGLFIMMASVLAMVVTLAAMQLDIIPFGPPSAWMVIGVAGGACIVMPALLSGLVVSVMKDLRP